MSEGARQAAWLLAFAAGFAVFFSALWCTINVILGFLGGWHELARAYRARAPFRGTSFTFQSARMWRITRYNHIFHVGVNPEGLAFSVFGLFRPGHPPLFIPWPELASITPQRLFLSDWVELRFRSARTPVLIPAALFERVQRAAGDSWPALPQTA